MHDTLKKRQTAAEQVEETMLAFLMDFVPCRDLTVGEVKIIASRARALAFDKFSDAVCD